MFASVRPNIERTKPLYPDDRTLIKLPSLFKAPIPTLKGEGGGMCSEGSLRGNLRAEKGAVRGVNIMLSAPVIPLLNELNFM